MNRINTNKKNRSIVVSACLGIVLIFSIAATVIAIQGKIIKSEFINDSKRHLIGEETYEDYYVKYVDGRYIDSLGNIIDREQLMREQEAILVRNRIVKRIENGIHIPTSIVEFETQKQNNKWIVNEIISVNGILNILTNTNGEGWNLKEGQRINYKFEKYLSDIVSEQNLIVGYIKNGILTEGLNFKKLVDTYTFEAVESGEYYIYFINASSDTISLKRGIVWVD